MHKEKLKNGNYLEEIERLSQIKTDLQVLTEKYEFLTKEYRYLVQKYEKSEQLKQEQEAKLNSNNNNKTNSNINLAYKNSNHYANREEDEEKSKIIKTEDDMENIKDAMDNPFLNNQRPTSESKKKKSKSKVKKKIKSNGHNFNTDYLIVNSVLKNKEKIAREDKERTRNTGTDFANKEKGSEKSFLKSGAKVKSAANQSVKTNNIKVISKGKNDDSNLKSKNTQNVISSKLENNKTKLVKNGSNSKAKVKKI